MFLVYLLAGIAMLFLFLGIISWRVRIFEGVLVSITLAVFLGISSYSVYDDMVTMQEYTVLEKVTITENENVKVYYIIKDEGEINILPLKMLY